jgi:nicotinamide-nucleotide amidase
MEKLFASVITIGDELLIGQVVDTNSAFIGQELNKIGVFVRYRFAVGDEANDIKTVLDQASLGTDIILITGGLGPTADDITKPLLCEYFGGKMQVHQPTLDHVTRLFEKVFHRPMIESNRKQAEIPDVCTVIPNEKGTAPGMLFEKGRKIYIAMPGVPGEMKAMMPVVLQIIQQRFAAPSIEHRTLLTMGLGESFLAEQIKDFEAALPSNVKLAYLPNYGQVRLRLTGHGAGKKELVQQMDSLFSELKSKVGDVLVADEDIPMEAAIGKLLLEKGKTMSTAESCTGGYIAHLLTAIPGSSAYYYGSLVSYDYRIKADVLKVKQATLDTHGAVSEETVKEMAAGALDLLQTDYTIAVSGIMGPGGATPDKPVGLVWMAAASKDGAMQTRSFHIRFDRRRNIEMTATNALNFLRKFIIDS